MLSAEINGFSRKGFVFTFWHYQYIKVIIRDAATRYIKILVKKETTRNKGKRNSILESMSNLFPNHSMNPKVAKSITIKTIAIKVIPGVRKMCLNISGFILLFLLF